MRDNSIFKLLFIKKIIIIKKINRIHIENQGKNVPKMREIPIFRKK